MVEGSRGLGSFKYGIIILQDTFFVPNFSLYFE